LSHLNFDGEVNMAKVEHDWECHLEALASAGIGVKAYAQKHGLGVSTLYKWKSKLRQQTHAFVGDDAVPTDVLNQASEVAPSRLAGPTALQAQPKKPSTSVRTGNFVALNITPTQQPHVRTWQHCTLNLGSCIRLELPDIPEPAWLASLARHTQGVH
jgi:transposase-like protein